MSSYVLIHGAGDVGWYWHLVEDQLRSRGHHSVAPDLPTDDDAAGLSTYADVVVDAIPERSDVVVVAQSFGGYVAPMVADRVDARLIASQRLGFEGWLPIGLESRPTRSTAAIAPHWLVRRNLPNS